MIDLEIVDGGIPKYMLVKRLRRLFPIIFCFGLVLFLPSFVAADSSNNNGGLIYPSKDPYNDVKHLGSAAYYKSDGAQVGISVDELSVTEEGNLGCFKFKLGAVGIVKDLPESVYDNDWTYPNMDNYRHSYVIHKVKFEVVGEPPSGKEKDHGTFRTDSRHWQENNEHNSVNVLTGETYATMSEVAEIISVAAHTIGLFVPEPYGRAFGGVAVVAKATSIIAGNIANPDWGPVWWWYDNSAEMFWEYTNINTIAGVSQPPLNGPEVCEWGGILEWNVPYGQYAYYYLRIKATIEIGHWDYVVNWPYWAGLVYQHDYYLTTYLKARVYSGSSP
ncbi:MAG: hypothetical protein ACXAEF_05345 [Candidatus Thorarchaeota archaeon]|jgi:hypothetical protein